MYGSGMEPMGLFIGPPGNCENLRAWPVDGLPINRHSGRWQFIATAIGGSELVLLSS